MASKKPFGFKFQIFIYGGHFWYKKDIRSDFVQKTSLVSKYSAAESVLQYQHENQGSQFSKHCVNILKNKKKKKLFFHRTYVLQH